MTWSDMVKIEPILLTIKRMARGNDSNSLRQMLDNVVGIWARDARLRTVEAFDVALLEIFYQ